jgi:large subunit ribosomal protein L5
MTLQEYTNNIDTEIVKQFPVDNKMALPKLKHISINVGCGTGAKKRYEQKDREVILKLLEKITGQKPTMVSSFKSIAGFKLRAGEIVGIKTTLRGKKMYEFLLRLIFISLPRTRDFRGLSPNHVDKHGNYSLGVKSAIIFPEVGFDSEVNFGMQVNLTFENLDPERSTDFIKILKLPINIS